MGISIPGLSEALGKLDKTADQMGQMIERLDKITLLLEEQNGLLKKETV